MTNTLDWISELVASTILTVGKAISGTFLDLFTSPDVLAQAQEEFESRIAAEPMLALISADFEATIDLPRPDYRARSSGCRHW